MPRESGSSRWLAERLQALGYDVSHATLNSHPDRVAYDDDGNPIGYDKPAWTPRPLSGRALGGYYGAYRRREADDDHRD